MYVGALCVKNKCKLTTKEVEDTGNVVSKIRRCDTSNYRSTNHRYFAIYSETSKIRTSTFQNTRLFETNLEHIGPINDMITYTEGL